MSSPARRLLLALRRRVKVRRPLTCELIATETARAKYRWTCTACSHSWLAWEPMARELAARFERYWGQGVTGNCPACAKAARDERYPLRP